MLRGPNRGKALAMMRNAKFVIKPDNEQAAQRILDLGYRLALPDKGFLGDLERWASFMYSNGGPGSLKRLAWTYVRNDVWDEALKHSMENMS